MTKIKATIFCAVILFSLFSCLAVVAAQSSVANSVTFAPTALSYVGKEGQTQLSRNLTFIGTTNQSVNVTLVATDLYDSTKGQTLSASDIHVTPSNFVVVGNQQQVVNVYLNTSSTTNGTYQGSILVTTAITNSTANPAQINSTSIAISVLIQPELSLFSSASNSFTYAPTALSFFGTNGQPELNRNITFIGVTNQTVNVNLNSTDLYDNNTGNTISLNKIEITPSNFTIEGNLTSVLISLKTGTTIGGTYSGTILVTTSIINSSTNNLQIATTTIAVSATVQAGLSSLIQPQFLILVFILALEIIAFAATANNWPSKNYFVLIVAILISGTWVYMLFVYGFSQINGILTTIGTIFVIPFFAFVINYVRDQWSTENDRRKSVREIENKGRENDIEMVRNILGELETHYASFNPFPYPPEILEANKKDETDQKKVADASTQTSMSTTTSTQSTSINTKPPVDQKILYKIDGKIGRKVWDEQCKQGVMSDLPLLELSIYYNFQSTYNGYYAWAVDHYKTTEKTPPPASGTPPAANVPLTSLEKFDNFRESYGKLETVLFIHLSYYMGLFVKTNLNPLPIKFPRVNKIFLKTLIDYNILDPTKYPGNFRDRSAINDVAGHSRDLFKLRKHKKKVEQPTCQKAIDRENSINEAKQRIDKWEMSVRLLRDVFNEIYDDNKVEKFYKVSEAEFAKKLLDLENKVKELDSIPTKYFEKEDSSKKLTLTLDDFNKAKAK